MLLCLWILLINYYERMVVKRVIRRCEWSKWEEWPENTDPHRVGLFADPQIMDAHSYPTRPWIVNYMTRLILDNYHKKNWRYIHYYLEPNTNFFLGDLFDGGRYWEDNEWFDEYKRFNDIFPKVPSSRTIMNVPGNHDIGFGDTIIEQSLQRFSTYFGEPSSYYDIGNHTFVLLDTISLSDEANPKVSAIPKEFLNEFVKGDHPLPRILLSHVPLYRNSEQQKCGELRESKNDFPIQHGDQYQTVIDPELSQEVLSKIKPIILFSGDDHDYCHITHSYHSDGVTKIAEETTVKSCAMNMGIMKPAIQLLSLYNPLDDESESTSYDTQICYLPDPYKPIKMYILMLLFTTGWLTYMCIFPKSFNKIVASKMGKSHSTPVSSLPLPVGTKTLAKRSTSVYTVRGPSSFLHLLSNAAVLLIMVLSVFTYYYSSI